MDFLKNRHSFIHPLLTAYSVTTMDACPALTEPTDWWGERHPNKQSQSKVAGVMGGDVQEAVWLYQGHIANRRGRDQGSLPLWAAVWGVTRS